MELKTKKIIYLISILSLSTFLLLILSILAFLEISKVNKDDINSKKIVATTTMLGDLSKQLTKGTNFQVQTLMTTGVDPHNYQAKPSDLRHIISADLIVTNGLHLEAQMQKAFKTLCQGKNNHQCKFFSAADDSYLSPDEIITGDKGVYADPHIWFSINLWQKVCKSLKEKIIEIIEPKAVDKSEIKTKIDENFEDYNRKLEDLTKDIKKKITETNFEQKEVYLITAHDAFSYLCLFLNEIQDQNNKKEFILEPIQGISTQDEASASRILELIPIIKEKGVKAIFTESSVPENTIQSLKENAVDFVKIVSPTKDNEEDILYSDSLNKENDYIKTFEHNIEIIFKYLGKN
ncbi:MAG: metal ABC transporter substrate-binding protein [Candidatus Phytoplasma pyri]|uniref:metal ABC transporter substrate-binding protein n=1 Tax=Candidatus Phytoplasma pyri TaxID=47566 RepID=UPI0039832FE9